MGGAAKVLNEPTPEEPKEVKDNKSDEYCSYYLHVSIITEALQ